MGLMGLMGLKWNTANCDERIKAMNVFTYKEMLLAAVFFSLTIFQNAAFAQGQQKNEPFSFTAESVISRIDRNLSSESAIIVSSMKIHGLRGTRSVKSKTWVQGQEKSFTEFLSPAREKGIKMLKLDDQLWTYYPKADRIVKISGHLLRDSLMGSDLSFEDMMEDAKLLDVYDAEIASKSTLHGKEVIVLALKAKRSDAAYQNRKIWVDGKRYVPVQEELYSSSGKLLKKVEMLEHRKIGNRWYPVRVKFKDMLKKGEGTEFIVHEINFDAQIDRAKFQKSALRR